jgi:hypothetical protein
MPPQNTSAAQREREQREREQRERDAAASLESAEQGAQREQGTSSEQTKPLPNDQSPGGPLQQDAPAVTHYQVTQGRVGRYGEGDVIPASALAGVDIQRLLDLGVLAPTDAPGEAA